VATQQQMLDFYTQPASMTTLDQYAAPADDLPDDVAGLARTVQGLLLHEHWAPAYGITLSDERRSQTHLRSAVQMLDCLSTEKGRSLTVARSLDERVVGTCRNFTVLFVALARAKGIPARARCGFGSYFVPGNFEDHWVAEYWNAAQERWVRVDAQLDAFQQEKLQPDFDVLDVPHNRFVIAGDAWARSRSGQIDPSKFGFSFLFEGGFWFIAGNLVRDFAALNNVEMLPWDVWGAMPGVNEPLNEEQMAFFGRLAALTRTPDACFEELRTLYEEDSGLRVPATVFNAILNQQETLAA
jgi:hypothetical protein